MLKKCSRAKVRQLAFIAAAIIFTPVSSHATLVSGFENGLADWNSIGDVSVQTNSVGTGPSQGTHQALITTLCDSHQVAWCETTNRELSYSGTSSAPSVSPHNGASMSAAGFLGLPTDMLGFSNALPNGHGMQGESGALRTSFYATAGTVLSFDWNHIALGAINDPQGSREADSSYFSLWIDDPLAPFRFSDYLVHDGGNDQVDTSSAVNLCGQTVSNLCALTSSYETGYSTRSITLQRDAWYSLGFAMTETAEGTIPSALAIDNVRLERVPEPATMGLWLIALLSLAVRHRQRTGVAINLF